MTELQALSNGFMLHESSASYLDDRPESHIDVGQDAASLAETE